MLSLLLLLGMLGAPATAYPEAEALPVLNELPDPLRFNDGTPVGTSSEWMRRREEIAELLLHYEYGHMPPPPNNLRAEEATTESVFDGAATLRQAVLTMGPERRARMRVALYVPEGRPGPFPVIVAVEPVWIEPLQPVAKRVTDAGYIFAGFERHDLDADSADRSDGVHPLYPDYDWASLAVWAWGCRRLADYLQTVEEVDESKLVLTGHSRAGKVALLAGALDERFAIVAPHASGAGGAGSFRIPGKGCESLEAITQPERFHYWFHPRLRSFAGREDRLPFDQHFLRALVAPRACLSIDGLDDHWANPLGTQRMYEASQPVFDLLGAGKRNAVLFRPGGHDTTGEDWSALIEFANHVFNDAPLTSPFNRLPFPATTAQTSGS